MTGREAVNYILINHYDDQELVIVKDGKLVPVADIVSEPLDKKLWILTCHVKEEEK